MLICCVSWLSLATPTNPLIDLAICCILLDNPFVISDGSLDSGECFRFIDLAVSTLGPASPSILDPDRSCCLTVCNMSYLYARCHKYYTCAGCSRRKDFLTSPSTNSYTCSGVCFSLFSSSRSLSIPWPDPECSQSEITLTILYLLLFIFLKFFWSQRSHIQWKWS